MSSRKEEERNEKIIRGLMKLPPNRRCINCNHMGPQYVCTNFWTFVCVTCSGIHREFTHRVKSVSMATFTSEEVEALQKGGNQRAREIYLKQWDSQSQRLPDNSNADKVREFIRNVYLNKKYLGGGSSDRPPRDLQNGRSRDEEIRRASSYHSYSQSPPNDFQYEERRYGKPVPMLTRKPGSDRGLYDGKVSSFLSPGRLSDRSPSGLSDHTNEDSCGGERFGSPLSETSRDFSGEDIVQTTENPKIKSPARRSFSQMLHPERTASLGSSGSLNSLSFGCASHEHEGPVAVHQDSKSTVPSLAQQSFSGSSDGLDLFNAPYAPAAVSSSSANVPEFPGSSSTRLIDLLENSPTSNGPTFSSSQQLQPILFPSLDVFHTAHPEPSAATSDKPVHFIPQNEGWATFESPQPVVPNFVGAEKSASDANSVGNSDENLLFAQWPSVENNSAHEPLPVMPPFWNANMQNGETLPSTSSSESWSAFEDSCSDLGKHQDQVPVHQSSYANHYLPTESEIGYSHESGSKSINPFDLPYDGENMSQFFEMGSLQAALPNVQAPSPFISGSNEHWFGQDTTAPYVDVNSDGGFGYIAGHAQTAQISTVSSHGSVASVGGNPFG